MNLDAETIGRLHKLHDAHVDRLRADVIAANVSLGSPHPERTRLERLTREAFEEILTNPCDPEVVRLWVRRFARGHEHEFPGLPFFADVEGN